MTDRVLANRERYNRMARAYETLVGRKASAG
jgi:hypothetical protein